MYEFRILRDRKQGDFRVANSQLDGTFYRNNLPQNTTFNSENIPKHFPLVGEDGQTVFVDAAQDPNIVIGFAFGKRGDRYDGREFENPLDTSFKMSQIQAAKPALSWDVSLNSTSAPRLAIESPGYMKYGRIGTFENDDDNPNIDIDYSGGERITGKILDESGNPGDPEPGEVATNNVILHRFPLSRYFNYTLQIPGDIEYTGYAFVHSGDSSAPRTKVKFENNKAEFNTGNFSALIPGPRLTIYLATNDYNVDEILVISRSIGSSSEDIIDWETTDKFRIDLKNAPKNYARRSSNWKAEGEANAIVWLEAGELITLASVSEEGRYRHGNMHSTYGWTNQEIDFELDISPFRIDEDWIKLNSSGNGTKSMNWNDPINFQTDVIDLVKFLPNDVRTDEFIDNFCKAFNLKLSQTGTTEFALDVKQTKKAQQNNFIDIDVLASVKDKANQPLGLPSAYSIGFTINEDEEGFTKTGDNGGGTFSTGAIEGIVTEQKSNFSFNWFKNIRKAESGNRVVNIPLPVISKAEVWTTEMTYPEAMSKRYTNLAQRFWYFDGLLNDLGVTFHFGKNNDGNTLRLAKVTNVLPGLNTLSYKDENNTILNNYFSLLTDANSHYTLIECYLQPEQYEEIGNGAKVRFNGDLYYVADVDGYDPLNKNMCTLKLIRLI